MAIVKTLMYAKSDRSFFANTRMQSKSNTPLTNSSLLARRLCGRSDTTFDKMLLNVVDTVDHRT